MTRGSSARLRFDCGTTLTVGLVFLVTWLASFSRAGQLGLLRDDWAYLGRLIYHQDHPLAQILWTRLQSWEWRPMHALDSLMLYGGFRLGGLGGAFLVIWLVISANGICFAKLLRRRWPANLALAGGLALALFPPDTTQLWAVMFVSRLGMLWILLAIMAFCNQRLLLAGLFCLLALFSYELSFFCFVLAPWFRDGGRRQSLLKALAVMAACTLLYGLVRLALPLGPDTKLVMLQGAGWGQILAAYGTALREVWGDLLWVWPFQTLRVALEPGIWPITGAALLGGSAVFFWLGPIWRESSPKAASPGVGGIFFGVAGILAGCAAAPIRPPTSSLSTLSRGNAFFAPAAIILLFCLISWGARRLPARWSRAGGAALALVGLALCFGFRYRIEGDYLRAAAIQEKLVQEVVKTVGALPPHTTLVILNGPEVAKDAAITPFLTDMKAGLHVLFHLLYHHHMSALAIKHLDVLQKTLDALRQAGKPLPQENLLAYDAATGTKHWIRRSPKTWRGPLIPPSGPVLALIKRGR